MKQVNFPNGKSPGLFFTREAGSEEWNSLELIQNKLELAEGLELFIVVLLEYGLTADELQDFFLGLKSEKVTLAGLSLPTAIMSDSRKKFDLMNLTNFTTLTALYITTLRYRDEELKNLANLINLEILELPGIKRLTDIGIAYLKNLENIHILNLAETQITNKTADLLADWPNLTALNLSATSVNGEVFPKLARLTKLEYLSLRWLPVTNSDLVHLLRLDKLKYLDISGTAIDDTSIIVLEKMRQLKVINVSETNISSGGKAILVNVLPHTKVLDQITVLSSFVISPPHLKNSSYLLES